MKESWFIAGFTGAGKSTALKEIQRLDCKSSFFQSYIDLDELFAKTWSPPGDYIRQFGEERFRLKEKDLLLRELAGPQNKIISLGGGALSEENLKAIHQAKGKVLGIEIDVNLALKRIEGDEKRPILDLDQEQILTIFHDREKILKKADYLVQNNGGLTDFNAAILKWYSCQVAPKEQ